MSKTEKNLQEAFVGESQANRKYLAFAKRRKRNKLWAWVTVPTAGDDSKVEITTIRIARFHLPNDLI